MDPPPPPTTAAAPKVRLLLSYGGHIVPRPHSTSLTYAGGDTKIISLHRASLSLSSLTSHLSRTLHVPPFLIKYQLPGEDLDALISVTTDEDLKNMIEEHDRLPAPTRIRLFLFPSRSESVGSGLMDPKSDSWFSDALKGANLMQRGISADSGLTGLDFGGDVAGGGKVAESMVMETGSSFGSTGSSVSMTNLPPIGGQGGQGEDIGGFEKKTKLPSPGSIESDNIIPSATSHQYTTTYRDPNIYPISTETSAQPIHYPLPNFQAPKTVQAGTHQASNQFHHVPELQYMQQPGSHYIPQYPPSYYHPMYYPPLTNNNHTHNPYPQNQQPLIYYLPVRPTHVGDTLGPVVVPPHPPMNIPVAKEVVNTPATPIIQVPFNQNQQQLVDISEINQTKQAVVNSEFEDEFAYTQIYKTQPSGPSLISQYQTMASGDNIK